MTPYADVERLKSRGEFYGVQVPTTADAAAPLLKLATADVSRWLGARWVTTTLEPEQVDALADGCAIQACRVAQGPEFSVGADDGLAAIGGVTFSTRTPARFSPGAAEALAGYGLYVRSGTVETLEVVDGAL